MVGTKTRNILKRKEKLIKKLQKQRTYWFDTCHSLLKKDAVQTAKFKQVVSLLEEERLKNADLISENNRLETGYQELVAKYRIKKARMQQLRLKYKLIDFIRARALGHNVIKVMESMAKLTVASYRFMQKYKRYINNSSNFSSLEILFLKRMLEIFLTRFKDRCVLFRNLD